MMNEHMQISLYVSDAFPADLNINTNKDCIYYTNHRIKMMPDATVFSEDESEKKKRVAKGDNKDLDGLMPDSAIDVVELVECLPQVYSRVVKTAIDAKESDISDHNVYDGATDSFARIAAYLNAFNAFFKKASATAKALTATYSLHHGRFIDEEIAARMRVPAKHDHKDEDYLPDGRKIAITFNPGFSSEPFDGYFSVGRYWSTVTFASEGNAN